MSDTVIRVENLGKKYMIGHQKQERYTALRDVIANGAKSFGGKLLKPFGQQISDPTIEEFWALKDVSFEIKQGDRVGIIGRNGAGKSTLLKILSRITEPTQGRISIKGRVASLLEVGTGFHPELTGRENIYLNGAILGMSKAEIKRKFDEIVAFAEVEKFLDVPVKRYSSGMYVRLAFAVAAHLEPEILVVDEVLAVGDAQFQKKCLGKMEEVGKEGRTVLFVSHNMAVVSNLCRTGLLLKGGQITKYGEMESIAKFYTKHIEDMVQVINQSFPICNNEFGLCLNNCDVTVDYTYKHFKLKINLSLEVVQPIENVGIGLVVKTLEGTKVCYLNPRMTNCVIEKLDNSDDYLIYCDEVNKYLAGGIYIIGIWLAIPRIKRILNIDEIARIEIQPSDIFGNGICFQQHQNGLVPLPIKLKALKNTL